MQRERRHHRLIIALLSTLALLSTACSQPLTIGSTTNGAITPTSGTPGSSGPTRTKQCTHPSDADCAPGSGITSATLYVEPDAKETPLVSAISGAKQTIDVEMYLLTDHAVINGLESASHRGVKVRVMLEGHPYGQGAVTPQETISKLKAAGIDAKTTNPAYTLTHTKLMLIDGQTAFISSANYTFTALGGSTQHQDRDYIVRDTVRADVTECAAIYDADWNRTTPALSDPNLVVSPINSRQKLLAIIGNAKTSLHIEEEEMQDAEFVAALITAAKHGIAVNVVVPKPTSGSSEAQNEQQLTQGGVKVQQIDDRTNGGLYIHAKSIIVDAKLAYIGSINASGASMDGNREIGILIADQSVIRQLDQIFTLDFQSVAAS